MLGVTTADLGPNERLERSQWDFFWVPADVEVLDRPDVAAVRCRRPLPHLNMVTRARVEPERAPGLVEEITAWLGAHRSRWLCPDTFDRGPLEGALTAARWAPVSFHEARVIHPARYARRPPAGPRVARVETLEALRDCVEVTDRAFGRAVTRVDAELEAELRGCAPRDGRTHRYVVYANGAPVASGGFNWFPDLRLAFLWAGGTVPEARGRGAYTALVAARVEAAKRLGAEWVGLYAKDDTSAPIVAAQGFERVGEMRFWAPWTVRDATEDDDAAVRRVAQDAARRFEDVGGSERAALDARCTDEPRTARRTGRGFVLDVGGEVKGFAGTSTVDDAVHLEALDVARGPQELGFRRALVERAVAQAREVGRRWVTLHTFAEEPWSVPLHRRLGFEVAPPDAQGPELAARTALDAAAFASRPRVCMRRAVERS